VRPIVLAVAREPHVRSLITHGPGRALARRFVAGETLDEAMATAGDLANLGARVSLDYLGEAIATFREAELAATIYDETIERLGQLGVPTSLALKPSQFGVDLAPDRCLELIGDVVARAGSHGVGVRLDMEDSAHTDRTLWLWRELHERRRDVGVVLQAALYRTPIDLETIMAAGGSVRLCKGAYAEPASIAYPRKADVDDAFAKLLDRLLAYAATASPVGPGRLPPAAIATHDEHLILRTIELVHRYHLDGDHYELQMLYGVRRDLQNHLLRSGYPLRVYVPWGPAWYPYLTRRLAERPANLLFFASALWSEATGRRSEPAPQEKISSLRR
jgi:proline dehydrogenase